VSHQAYGNVVTTELVAGGGNVPVTDANKNGEQKSFRDNHKILAVL
jgi:hypothetical protein